MTQRKDIGLRLENWARWATAYSSRGADCMTGAICESLRRAALGDVWSGHEVRDRIDSRDAERIQLAMPKIDQADRWLLHWCYIKQERPEVVARLCRFPIREFVQRFRAAQRAVEQTVDSENSGQYIPNHNLFPSV